MDLCVGRRVGDSILRSAARHLGRGHVDTCERCGGTLVIITINVAEGTRTLQSCSKCDRRSWRADGEPVKLDGVLADLSDDAAKRAEAMRR